MAERLEPMTGAHLAAVLDRGEVVLEREGFGHRAPCRIGVLALDEGLEGEGVGEALADRLALHVELPPGPPGVRPSLERVRAARRRQVAVDGGVVEALCQAAVVLGIASLRAPLHAAQVARIHAALRGASAVREEDVGVAARLVLGPRATRLPPEAEEPPPPPPDEDESEGEGDDRPTEGGVAPDRVLEAAASGIPAGLLDRLKLRERSRGRSAGGKAGAVRQSMEGGRPAGVRSRAPRPGDRLAVVDTLRAAAPWQRIRPSRSGRVAVRPEDFRVHRYRKRTETTVIFAVDASGSAALQRLAEAKGAAEQVLADCYVRRDQVALIAFRNREADVLLPPTRSLTRARRSLARMVGGGTTPLAHGIDAAHRLALDARRQGRTPLIVVMTDGRANVDREGQTGGTTPTRDALASARRVAADEIAALFLDTAPRPRPRARALAEAMAARYLPLPYLDAKGISRQVQELAETG
jgi:magnesium chelatase subunit D